MFFIFLARVMYSSVLTVSSALKSDKLTVATIHVFVLPPSESLKRRVSLLSRYGMNDYPSTRLFITRPSVSNDLFIFDASCWRND